MKSFLGFSLFCAFILHSFSLSAGENNSAYEVYQKLRQSAHTFEQIELRVNNTNSQVNEGLLTFGAEKEGSSARLVRVAGPSSDLFIQALESSGPESKELFLRSFLTELSENKVGQIQRLNGELVQATLDTTPAQLQKYSLEELENVFQRWLSQTADSPYSFMKLSLRRKLFYGELPGMNSFIKELNNFSSGQWRALHGKAEAFIMGLQPQNTIKNGWEINFKPQRTYGEFENMIDWFRKIMGSKDELFQSPGHHRLVFPTPEFTSTAQLKAFKEGLAETYKIAQAYAVLRGVKGKTGINMGQWKFMMSDSQINSLDRRANEIFRLEKDYIARETMSLEMRAGTKDRSVQRLIQQVVASRVSTQDFDDLQPSRSWKLISDKHLVGGFPDTSESPKFPKRLVYNVDETAKRFNVERELVEKAFENLSSIERRPQFGIVKRVYLNPEFWIPFWNWENAPFVSSSKKGLLQNLTRAFIENVASLTNPTELQVQELLSDWSKVSNLDMDMEDYLRPKPKTGKSNYKPHHFKLNSGGRAASRAASVVDVNKIDLGIEYSARFPLQNEIRLTDEMLADGKYHWIATAYDFTDRERQGVLKEVAETLSEELGGTKDSVRLLSEQGEHGHGLGIAFSLKDAQNREWRVEWDGVGRSYESTGNLVKDSARGGHIEIVTPKFRPEYEQMQAVYRAFDKTRTLPRYSMGGAHLNIDLSVFEGRPRELARFMALFHEYRDIISLMYQHPKRLLAAEPIEVAPRLQRQLADFQGTEKELKKLLYNERYFNDRVGRKTRYNQLDLSSYFQDIIPEQYIMEDFDIGNPNELWRRQFRVDPKIRKMEFRLFGAPESAHESALQVRLVRAMLDKALNETSPLSGRVATVDYAGFRKNPSLAVQRLKQMSAELGLDFEAYTPALARGLDYTDEYFNSIHYRPFQERISLYPRVRQWSEALETPRTEGLSSKGRFWAGSQEEIVGEAENLRQIRIEAAHKVDSLRQRPGLVEKRTQLARNDQSCLNIMNYIFNNSSTGL